MASCWARQHFGIVVFTLDLLRLHKTIPARTVGTRLDIVTVVSPTGASTHTSYIPFLRQRGEASTGGCLGTSMASNGLNIAEFRGLVY